MRNLAVIVMTLMVGVPGASGQAGDGDASVPMAPMRIQSPLEAANGMIERFPREPGVWQRRADVHRFALRLEEAHADLTTALRLNPGYERARLERAMVRRDLGRYDEALEDLAALFAGGLEDPTRTLQAYEIEASVRIAQRDWRRAMSAIERATDFDGERGLFPWLRARVLLAQGREEEGMAALVATWESGVDLPVWSVVRPVTALERRVIASMPVRLKMTPDMEETPDDVPARAWFDTGSKASIAELERLASTDEGRGPGARGLVAWAQHCAHAGRDEEAARAALVVYLGEGPADQRLMALMVYLRTAPAGEGGAQLARVESGERDAAFAWALPTLRALHAVRAATE